MRRKLAWDIRVNADSSVSIMWMRSRRNDGASLNGMERERRKENCLRHELVAQNWHRHRTVTTGWWRRTAARTEEGKSKFEKAECSRGGIGNSARKTHMKVGGAKEQKKEECRCRIERVKWSKNHDFARQKIIRKNSYTIEVNEMLEKILRRRNKIEPIQEKNKNNN